MITQPHGNNISNIIPRACKKLQSNQSKWIASLIEREFKLEQRKKIDRVLSGVDSANFKSLKTPNNL